MRLTGAWLGGVLFLLSSPQMAAGQGASTDPRWSEAQAAEIAAFTNLGSDRKQQILASRSFLKAGEAFGASAQLRESPQGAADAYWRAARSYWLAADALGQDATDERVRYYERAESLADAGIALNPECAPCMLWKFSSMGRLATTRGIWTAARQVPVMAELLDRAIELEPRHADRGPDVDNSVLGNLHYSSAIFYRLTPDWFLLRWVLGVRGDKERALSHIKTALALHPARIDYRVELGSQLLCFGTSERDARRLRKGLRVMREVIERPPKSLDDEREQQAARIMLDDPRKSCGYSGDAWIELDREKLGRALAE